MRAEQFAGTLVNRNSFYNVQSYNNQAAAKNSIPLRANEKNGRRDTANISPMQRANSMIEAIRKQKQNIVENKNQLVKNTMEAGKDIETIKPQLDSYNELLQTLDEQIVGIMTAVAQQKSADTEKQLEKVEASKDDEPKTEEELETKRLSNIASATDSLKQSEVVSSSKRRAVGEARVKQTEVMQSELTIDMLDSKKKTGYDINVEDMISSERRTISRKTDEITALNNTVTALSSIQGEKVMDAVTKLNENSKPVQEDGKDGIEDSRAEELPTPPAEEAVTE